MTATKSKYWGVTRKRDKPGLRKIDAILFEGTFAECWAYMVEKFGTMTLRNLQNDGYQISRIK